jgi:hypothetical protein
MPTAGAGLRAPVDGVMTAPIKSLLLLDVQQGYFLQHQIHVVYNQSFSTVLHPISRQSLCRRIGPFIQCVRQMGRHQGYKRYGALEIRNDAKNDANS